MSSDLFGLLPLPWVGDVNPDAKPAGDPLLDVVLQYMKAAVNADLRDLWARICPSDPLPVACTFWHNPDPANFSTKATPAIYAWRAKSAGNRTRFSQGYTSKETPVQCLWVPPPLKQDAIRQSEPFANALEACIKDAFVVGRHPAWKVAGDDYYSPEHFGSVLSRHTGASRMDVTEFGPFDLTIEMFDNAREKMTFACLAWKLDVLELLERSPTRRYAVPHTQLENTLQLGSDPDNLLDVLTATFTLSVDSVAPTSGGIAGGTLVTVVGSQLVDGMSVLFGTTPGTNATRVDESTLTVLSPAHDAGLVDVTVQAPSGGSVTLANAFTFA